MNDDPDSMGGLDSSVQSAIGDLDYVLWGMAFFAVITLLVGIFWLDRRLTRKLSRQDSPSSPSERPGQGGTPC